jgi:hypothetical protein
MRSQRVAAATIALAGTIALIGCLALASCKNRDEKPIPGPKATSPTAAESVLPPSSPTPPSAPASNSGSSGPRRHGAAGISWFQGTVEEAFSTSCAKCTAMFWH